MEMSSPKFSAVRAPGREHIPLYPKNWIAMRIVQLVLAVIIMALGAYGIAMIPTSGDILIVVVVGFSLFTLIPSIRIPSPV